MGQQPKFREIKVAVRKAATLADLECNLVTGFPSTSYSVARMDSLQEYLAWSRKWFGLHQIWLFLLPMGQQGPEHNRNCQQKLFRDPTDP